MYFRKCEVITSTLVDTCTLQGGTLESNKIKGVQVLWVMSTLGIEMQKHFFALNFGKVVGKNLNFCQGQGGNLGHFETPNFVQAVFGNKNLGKGLKFCMQPFILADSNHKENLGSKVIDQQNSRFCRKTANDFHLMQCFDQPKIHKMLVLGHITHRTYALKTKLKPHPCITLLHNHI